jgi:hypothetical protein
MGIATNGPAASPPAPWPPGLTRLLLLFEISHSAFAATARELRRSRPQLPPAELNARLLPPAVALIRAAAQSLAEALGCGVEDVLRLCDPGAVARQLEGTHGTLRRLDRFWGGAPLVSLEALTPLVMTWPEPVTGHLIALQGKVQVNGADLHPHDFAPLPAGTVLGLDSGALVLLRRTVVAQLVEAALAAGFRDIIADCCRVEAGLEVTVGPFHLQLNERLAVLNDRSVRLTELESRALALLARHPGEVQGRAAMMSQLQLTSARALDRVILSLRDKLGDGLIATVYGSGYALECLEKSAAR